MAARNGLAKYELHNIWFNDREKANYEKWLVGHSTAILDLLLEVQENGFKLSISSQDNGSTSLISISVKPKGKQGAGQVFMYRHSDLEKSIRIAHYHFTQVLNFGGNLEVAQNSVDW